MAKGFGIGALILGILSIFAFYGFNFACIWLAMICAAIAALNGERPLTIATIIVSFVGLLLFSPFTMAVIWGNLKGGHDQIALLAFAPFVLPIAALIADVARKAETEGARRAAIGVGVVIAIVLACVVYDWEAQPGLTPEQSARSMLGLPTQPTVSAPSDVVATDKYAAVAYSESTHGYGSSYDFNSQAEADSGALGRCGNGDCKVVARATNSACVALATNSNHAWGATWAYDSQTADQKALSLCQQSGSVCGIVASACGNQLPGPAPTVASAPPPTPPNSACGYVLSPAIYQKWRGEQRTTSIGCPDMTDGVATVSAKGTTGRWVHLVGGDGNFLVMPTNGPHAGNVYHVQGCMFMLYSKLGGTGSVLGFPTSDEYEAPGGLQQDFEGGNIFWVAATHQCSIIAPAPAQASAPTPVPAAAADDSSITPSYQCFGSLKSDEQTICNNRDLAVLERETMGLYPKIRARFSGRVPTDVRDYARAALVKRHSCTSNANCITDVLLAEKAYFNNQLRDTRIATVTETNKNEGYSYIVGLDPHGDDWLALRSEPSATAGVRLAKMGHDTLFKEIGRQGDWIHVQLPSGQIGWANSRFIACCRKG